MMQSATARIGWAATLALVLLVGTAMAEELWTEDAKEAMSRAAKEHKDLLIDFTGSDWCGWCMKLDKEVFGQESFATEAAKSFVFLKLDFPRTRALSEETKKQNAEWQAKFAIAGFPTIILADAEGRAYARTGYRRGGPEAYLKHLMELRAIREKRDAALAKAAGAEGIERAKLLDEALSVMDRETVLASYGETIAEIIKLDAGGQAGLKAKYEGLLAVRQFDAALRSCRTADEAIAAADEALKTLGTGGDLAQLVLFKKGAALAQKGDKDGCLKTLEEALKAAPDSELAGRIKKAIETISSQAK